MCKPDQLSECTYVCFVLFATAVEYEPLVTFWWLISFTTCVSSSSRPHSFASQGVFCGWEEAFVLCIINCSSDLVLTKVHCQSLTTDHTINLHEAFYCCPLFCLKVRAVVSMKYLLYIDFFEMTTLPLFLGVVLLSCVYVPYRTSFFLISKTCWMNAVVS